MKIAFSGCRDAAVSDDTIASYASGAEMVLVGDCPTGVDLCVREWCERAEQNYFVFEAHWDKYGRAAGPERNQRIAAAADRLVAFWDGVSRGTRSAITQAVKAGVPVQIIPAGRACQ
jgi:hypothetical protein